MAVLTTAMSPAPVVTVVNKSGSTAVGYTGNITMSLSVNPTGATLGGTVTVAATAGVATFSNLTMNRSGKNFKLLATGATQGSVTPRTKVSEAFTISTQLTFTTQPSATQPDALFTVVVAAKDTAGTTDTAYTGTITISLYSGSGTLSGTLSRAAVSGVATFTGLSIDDEGTYSLNATGTEVSTAYLPAPAVSSTFTISNNQVISVTVTEYSGTWWGYNSGNAAIIDPFGSITPTTVDGSELFTIYQESGSSTRIIIEGTHAATFFTSVATSTNTLLTSAAAFSTDNDGVNFWSIWDWGVPIFNTAESTTNATFTI